MKKLTLTAGVAVLTALVLTVALPSQAIEERLVGLHVAQLYPDHAQLSAEPLHIQALIVDYHDDPILRLKAEAALMEYPTRAREVLMRYGTEPEFQAILRYHGSSVLAPIDYFIQHDIRSLAWQTEMQDQWRSLKTRTREWWSAQEAVVGETSQATEEGEGTNELTPHERGWHAIHLIAQQGHGFLGQFSIDTSGNITWIQSERWLEAGNRLFADGIRQLETRWQNGEVIGAGDIGWALLDGAVMVSAVKVLRAGRMVGVSGRVANSGRVALATRSAGVSRLLSVGRYAKWPTMVAGGYMLVRHPSLIHDMLASVAQTLGYPVWLVQFLGWCVLLIPLIYLVSWIVKGLLPLAIRFLRGAAYLLVVLERRGRSRRYLFR